MKKTIIISTIIISIVLLWVWIAIATNDKKVSRIGELSQQIFQLQEKKQNCYDNLTQQETIQNHEWKARFCFEYDEKIQTLRAEFDELTDLPYKHIKSGSGL